MPCWGSSAFESVLRVPKLTSFSRVALMRASDTSSTIFWTCGLTALGSAGVETVDSSAAAAAARRTFRVFMDADDSGAIPELSYDSRQHFQCRGSVVA